MKKWQILSDSKKDDIIKILLENRGVKTKKEIEDFLNPKNPCALSGSDFGIDASEIKTAVKRIKKAIETQESVVVYSDYDADGVCGGALLWEVLYKLGAKVMPYIPHRVDEGYGLSQKGIDSIKEEYKATLIITVDHGITAWEKVEYCKSLGIDVIITDHHVIPEKIPKALAIVHTTNLCGTGVAWALAKELKEDCGSYLDLVAMATIADMIPLIGVNRAIVKYGMKELNKTKRIGLKALILESGLKEGGVGVYDVSHILTPRLNAMGRMEHAMDSLRLLCTNDVGRANELARHLSSTNKERQKLMDDTTLHAKNSLMGGSETFEIKEKLIFLSHKSYNQGVIGLVAGKLVEQFYRPAIVVSWGEVYSKASARSISGFNIIETIRQASDLLVDAGGHPMAAGFTVETKNLELLKQRLTEIAERELDAEKLTRVLKIDCELSLDDINTSLYEDIGDLSPFGLGNPEPVFCSNNVEVSNAKKMGKDGRHLSFLVRSPFKANPFRCIAFGMGDLYPELSPDKPIDIAFSLSLNEWNGEKRLELRIKDIRID